MFVNERLQKMSDRLRKMGHQRVALLFETALSVMGEVESTLKKHGIEHCFIGGIVLPFFNYDRPTGDIDVLINGSQESLIEKEIKKKHMRRVTKPDGTYEWCWNGTDVAVGFVYSGRKYNRKGIAFPDPDTISIEGHGIRMISLDRLILHKIDSGTHNPVRQKDHADVNALIRLNMLERNFAKDHNFPVALRKKFEQMHDLLKAHPGIKK